MIDEKKILEVSEKYRDDRRKILEVFARLFSKTLKKMGNYYDSKKEIDDEEERIILGHLFVGDLIEMGKISGVTCIEAILISIKNKDAGIEVKFINRLIQNIVDHFKNKKLN